MTVTPRQGDTAAQRERRPSSEEPMSDTKKRPPTHPTDRVMTRVVGRNIQALLARRQEEERRKRLQDRTADAITRFTGSMRFVYIHLALFGLWILVNLGWLPIVEPFDPTFVVLAMAASVEAIFLATFVLISQNRMTALADKRADLDLQVSLLTEHEITRLIQLVTAMARHMGLDESRNPELHELAHDVAPERVLDEMEKHEQQFSGKPADV
jgi:uncharacterized membrane protein